MFTSFAVSVHAILLFSFIFLLLRRNVFFRDSSLNAVREPFWLFFFPYIPSVFHPLLHVVPNGCVIRFVVMKYLDLLTIIRVAEKIVLIEFLPGNRAEKCISIGLLNRGDEDEKEGEEKKLEQAHNDPKMDRLVSRRLVISRVQIYREEASCLP